MVKRKQIIIGATDEDADWMHSLPGYKDELKIHEILAKKYRKKITKKPRTKKK